MLRIMKNRIFYHYLIIAAAAGYFPQTTSVGSSRRETNSGGHVRCYENSHPCGRSTEDDFAAHRSRTCAYKFHVGRAIDVDGTSMRRVINGTSPGPPIEICLGDTIEVVVENGLSSEELGFHWHGLRLMGVPHMDGVPMISQCPIMPYTSFRYRIKPESIGTYFYHAHSVRQQGDGLYGSLIVRGPRDDPNTEIVLLVSARPSASLSELAHLHRPIPRSLLINGQMKDHSTSIDVEIGRKYLFRLVNANVFNCPVLFFVVGHDLDVTATDARPIGTKISARRIIIFPGERFDVAISTNKTPGEYVIGFQGFEDCAGLTHETSLNYDGHHEDVVHRDDTLYLDRDDPRLYSIGDSVDDANFVASTVSSLTLVDRCASTPRNNGDYVTTPVTETRYVPFDVNSYDDIDDRMTDYSFNIYDHSYYPSYLSSGTRPTKVGQVNRMTFQYPSSPILSQPGAIDEDTLCSIEKRAKLCQREAKYFCQCTQILRLPARTTVDVVLVDQGFGGNVSHAFHVHGYDVEIVKIGRFDGPKETEEIRQSVDLDERREGVELLRKDTFVVPNKGYAIARIRTDNVGYWLWEARSTGLWDTNGNERPPIEFVMLVGNRENLPIVPIDFPTCGDHKSPASIFEDAN